MFYDWLSLFIAIHTERLDEPRKDVITFGSAIHACGADWKRAISFLQQMQDEKVPINLYPWPVWPCFPARQNWVYYNILYMLYWKTTETILISGMVLKKPLLLAPSIHVCWNSRQHFNKTLPMKRWRAATRQDYTQCCDWCLRGRQSLAGGNPTAWWSRYSSLLAVTWPKPLFDLCPKWLDNHTKVSRLTLFISL